MTTVILLLLAATCSSVPTGARANGPARNYDVYCSINEIPTTGELIGKLDLCRHDIENSHDQITCVMSAPFNGNKSPMRCYRTDDDKLIALDCVVDVFERRNISGYCHKKRDCFVVHGFCSFGDSDNIPTLEEEQTTEKAIAAPFNANVKALNAAEVGINEMEVLLHELKTLLQKANDLEDEEGTHLKDTLKSTLDTDLLVDETEALLSGTDNSLLNEINTWINGTLNTPLDDTETDTQLNDMGNPKDKIERLLTEENGLSDKVEKDNNNTDDKMDLDEDDWENTKNAVVYLVRPEDYYHSTGPFEPLNTDNDWISFFTEYSRGIFWFVFLSFSVLGLYLDLYYD